jgi:hypothetical protein
MPAAASSAANQDSGTSADGIAAAQQEAAAAHQPATVNSEAASSSPGSFSVQDLFECYSFLAYRQISHRVVWVDEIYTADCVRQQGVARWLMYHVGRGKRVELQVSSSDTRQAEDARRSYTSMGMRAMTQRERSRVVQGADGGYELWFTDEYLVMSGWEPVVPRDTIIHRTWSAFSVPQQDALIQTLMRVHDYSRETAVAHLAGRQTETEATILAIHHDLTAAPPPSPPSPPFPYLAGRRAVDEGGGIEAALPV